MDAPSGPPGRIVYFVTGDPLAFGHTAAVIGEVQGEVVPLPVTELIDLQLGRTPRSG
jgi:hypothetical protein